MKNKFYFLQKNFIYLLILVFNFIQISCARVVIESREEALVPSGIPSGLTDDQNFQGLSDGLNLQIEYLKKLDPNKGLQFGRAIYKTSEYLESLIHLQAELKSSKSKEEILEYIQKNFQFFQSPGNDGHGEVLYTSYFEAEISGSKKKTEKFSRALYSTPADLLSLDLKKYDPKFEKERKLRARISGKEVEPYFTREEIDSNDALVGRKLELAWVDPIDAFSLQVQGSGVIDFENGEKLILGYAEKNGQPYVSIGKFLTDVIPSEKMSWFTIENYLRSISIDDVQKIFNKNPSYVFFKVSDQNAVTSIGVPATAGRTIAADAKLFPKGALTYIQTTAPQFASDSAVEPSGEITIGRFALDQDVGGAIVGAGHVDLFWGRGGEAKKNASFMKNMGKLYYLAPKKDKF